MGFIQQGKEQVALGSRVCVGRSAECGLAIPDRRVSGRHAELVWTRKGWQVRDLGSTNGTTLDGVRLEAGKDYSLSSGSVLAFGDPENQWKLIDATPPQALAIATSGLRRAAEDGLLALPDDDHLEAVIFESHPGAWIAEVEGEPRAVKDQDCLSLNGDTWRLCLPRFHEETLAISSQVGVQPGLHFEVSRDEEFIRIWFVKNDARVEVATRAHHYMLLLLARARMEDQGSGLASGEAGWLYAEDFCKMLGTEPHLLNVMVHRARQQFARLEMEGAAGLIERRRSTRQMRIGVDQLAVSPIL